VPSASFLRRGVSIGMADAVQPIQRNLYQKNDGEIAGFYCDGRGTLYSEQLKRLSYVSSDVPLQAQLSARRAVGEGAYRTLHPMHMWTTPSCPRGRNDEPTFTQTYGRTQLPSSPTSITAVHERLYSPAKVQSRPSPKPVSTPAEVLADSAFDAGRFEEAIRQYTLGLTTASSLYAYEKRCAALAHVGRYQEALRDAEFILWSGGGSSPSAQLRVKVIKDFLRAKSKTAPGYQNGTATLICALTPRLHRQWRSITPSPYTYTGRPPTM